MPAPFLRESRISNFCHRYNSSVADPGEGPGGPPPFIFGPNGGPPPPPLPPSLSQGLDPPLSRILFSFAIPHLCPNFGESRFPRSSQIPYPVKESRIPHCVLFKSRIPGKSFQTLKKRIVPDFSETFVNV